MRALLAALVLVLATFVMTSVVPAAPDAPPADLCGTHVHLHNGDQHKVVARRAWAKYNGGEPRNRFVQDHKHMKKCARSDAARKRMANQWDNQRRSYKERFYWEIEWDRLDAGWQSWALSTGSCESGNDPGAHGGPHHGAFQFLLSTWASAPGSPGGDPHNYSWTVQAVVSVWLAQAEGKGHWPNCG